MGRKRGRLLRKSCCGGVACKRITARGEEPLRERSCRKGSQPRGTRRRMRKSRRKRGGDGTGRTAAGEACEGQRRAPSFKEGAKRGHGIVFRTSLCANAEICGGAYFRKPFLPCPSFMRACGAHRGAARVIGRHLISGRSAFAALPRPAPTFLSRTLPARLLRVSVPRISPAQPPPHGLARTFTIPLLHLRRIPQQYAAPLPHSAPFSPSAPHSVRRRYKNIRVAFPNIKKYCCNIQRYVI